MEVVEIISTVGFPIGACVVLFKIVLDLSKTIANLNSTLTSIDLRIDTIERKIADENSKA